ncbi:MAG: helix-turn-helix domain-containing protein [Saccharothrix sp.]|nr:helix-turn-helix domain-containing protein [Saccharothrix sp.]
MLSSYVDPVAARSSAEFVSLLRSRREVAGLSYRQLERRARQDGGCLPPSTVATMLRRSTLPGRELVVAYVRACGGDEDEVAAWLAARTRLATAVEVPRERDDVPAFPVPPRQLPPCGVALVGRRDRLAELDAATGGTESPLVVVTGPPGVGKTALAVHWAHRVRDRFPDGQLYVEVRASRPVADVVAELLAGLGVHAGSVPSDQRQAAALFRSVVADRRVLLLVDGVVTAEQVRLLRPGGAGSCMVVTSRDRLVGLAVYDGARVVETPPLDRGHAVRVLAQAAGEHRVSAELTAAGRLAELCDRLPLALRIAATALDPSSATPVADLVVRMRAVGRLAALEVHGDPEVGLDAVFGRSCDALDDVSRRLFRTLATLPPAGVAAVAAAAALDPAVARTALGRLVNAHLAVRLDGDRYAVPGLLREYAGSLLPAGEPAVA